MKKTVLVLFGGKSTEYEISLCSAASVLRNIPQQRYDILSLGITKDGEWFLFDGSPDDIENNTWQNGPIRKAFLSPDFGGGLYAAAAGGFEKIPVDIVFPVLHGKNGEDGTIQGYLELAGIPYVGCGHLSSALTMDKEFSNLIADYHGIRQAKWLSCKQYEYQNNRDAILDSAEQTLGYPIFVKPACAGSSVGISKAVNREQLHKAAELALTIDSKIIFEETIKGREIECAVLGNDKPIASAPGEIEPCAEFYDYDAKYISESKLYIPARTDESTAEKIRNTASKIFEMFDGSGLSRVDFFLTDDNELYFNEINTIPGFTKISMYAKLFDYSGISYPELVDRLLCLAEERFHRR